MELLFSFIAVLFGLLSYVFLGIKLIEEKKIFLFHFSYIFFYFLLVPFFHIFYGFTTTDLFFSNFNNAFFYLNFVNVIGILFALLGFIVAHLTKKKNEIKINGPINWLVIRNIGLVYVILSSAYLVYLISAGKYFYVESKSELAETGVSLIDYMFIEATPLIFTWVVIANLIIKNKQKFWLGFIFFVIIAILFSGVRGSRIAVIFQVINFILLYSYIIGKINWKKIFIFILLGWCFNSIFSAYKYGGIESLKSFILTGEKPTYLEKQENQTLSFLLLDLGRANIQAKVLESYVNNQYHPPYHPITYLSAVNLLLPKNIRADIDSKRILGTEAQYGFRGDDNYSSSRIYGLLGESILNFGYYSFCISFFIFGFLHYRCIQFISKVKNTKLVILIPLAFFIPIYLLFYDLDNIVFQLVKNWTFPLIIFLGAQSFKK